MNYNKISQEETDNFVNDGIEYMYRSRLEYLLPLFAENLRSTLDHGDADSAVLIRFYLTMEVARARLLFERFGDDIIVKAAAPGYTVACLMPRRQNGRSISYEDLMKLMNSDKPDLS